MWPVLVVVPDVLGERLFQVTTPEDEGPEECQLTAAVEIMAPFTSDRSSARVLSSTNGGTTSGYEIAATLNGQRVPVLAAETPGLGATSLGERRFASTEATPRPDCLARNA